MTLELGGNAVPLGTEVFGRLLCFHTAVFQRRTVFFVLLRKLSALCLKLLFEDRAGFFVELLLLLGDLLVCKERQATEAVRDSVALFAQTRGHIVDDGELFVELADGKHGDDGIRDKQRDENTDQNCAEREGNPVHERRDSRMNNANDDDDTQAPEDAEF